MLGFQPDVNAIIAPEFDVIVALLSGVQILILTDEGEVEGLLRPVYGYLSWTLWFPQCRHDFEIVCLSRLLLIQDENIARVRL